MALNANALGASPFWRVRLRVSLGAVEGDTYTVAELGDRILAAVQRGFPEEVWVRGQIRDLSRPATGHVYFLLVDPDTADESNPAVLNVTLFASDREAVNQALIRAGALRMTDGVEVRIRGRVTYYPIRGTAQLQMTWIDTDFTLGKLAAQREQLLRRLREEGLTERNRAIPLGLVPLRLAVVTSADSAAAADFLHELETSGFAFWVTVVDARVQGAEAPRSVAAALDTGADLDVDVVALVRGGGSATDLAPFDGELIARAIAQCPVPVFTGIGHEVDRTVADVVAHSSFKTPTACASALAEIVAEYLASTDRTWRATADVARRSLQRNSGRVSRISSRGARAAATRLHFAARLLDGSNRRLDLGATRSLARSEHAMERSVKHLNQAAHRHIRAEGHLLDAAASRVAAADPAKALRRGWSITRDEEGSVIRSVSDLRNGDELHTTFADGSAVSVVEALQTSTEEGTIAPDEAI